MTLLNVQFYSEMKKIFNKKFELQGIVMVLAAALLLAATSIVQFFFSSKAIRAEAERRTEKELTITSLKIDAITASIESAVKNISSALTDQLGKPDNVYKYLERMLDTNQDLLDVALAFSPDYYPEKGYWYEPVATRLKDGTYLQEEIGSESHDYFKLEWYSKVAENGIGGWSEPYYDDTAGMTMVVTYAEPVFDENGILAAVLGADLALDWLTSTINNIRLYPGSYSTVVSREGQLLAAPAETLAVEKPIRFQTTLDDETGWRMNIVIPEKEIFEGVKKAIRRISLFQFLGLLILIFILRIVAKGQLKLKEVEDNKDRIENELKIASGIQMSMIPKTFPPFPERKDLDVAAAMYPAKEVGGDMYDFYIRDEKLFFCIGDVSGKGVPASLVMAVTRSLFRTVSSHERSPRKIVTTMNDSMAEMNENSMFVTFFCGVLDLVTGHLRYCNAGHNAPLLLRDKITPLKVKPNLALGVLPGTTFSEQEMDLSYDDALFLYTDGLTEAEDDSLELFGEERVIDVLTTRRPSKGHLDAMQDAVRKFVGQAPQSDDLTMLFIHYLNDTDADAMERHLILHNDIREIPQLAGFIKTIADEMNLDNGLAMSLNLALEEAVTNVIMYAYPKDSDGLVDIEAIMRKKSLDFIITDSGVPFDPTTVPVADVTLGVEERPIGGLGIFLVRKIMDTVNYSRVDGKNILSMTKTI